MPQLQRLILLLFLLLFVSCAPSKAPSPPTRTAAPPTPEERIQLDAEVTRLERAFAAAPEDAAVHYALCYTYDQARELAKALRCVQELEHIGWTLGLKPSHFENAWAQPAFQAIARRLNEREPRVSRSQLGFTAPAELVPENVALDPKTGAFFLGSIAQRKIVRIQNGRVRDLTQGGTNSRLPPLLCVLGMKVDPVRRTLWAATEKSSGTFAGKSALVVFDVDTGDRIAQFEPEDGKPHLFNDVVVTAAAPEDAFVTDSVGGGVYRVSARGALQPFLRPGTLVYPNGIALSPDEKKLFIAHETGIAIADIARGTVTELAHPASIVTGGIDGLYVHRDGLVAVQNGVGRARVIRLQLDATWSSVVRREVLESVNPAFDSATTGVLDGDRLYYIANSQFRKLGPEGQPIAPLEDVRVLTLPLSL